MALPATLPSAPPASSARRDALDTDAGISLLEVMVGLAMLALVMSVATASLIGRPFTGQTTQQTFADFITDLQRQAARTGQAYSLEVSAGHAEGGGQKLDWDATAFSVRSSRDDSTSLSVVLFPNGTALGPDLVVVGSGKQARLGLVQRYEP